MQTDQHKVTSLRSIVIASMRFFFKQKKKRFYLLIAIIILCAVVDVACFSTIIPVIYLINDPQPITNNPVLHFVYDSLGFNSNIYFILFLLFGLVFVFVLKNLLLLSSAHLQNKFIFGVAFDITSDQTERLFAADWLDIRKTNSQEYVRYLANSPQRFATNVLLPLLMMLYEAVVIVLVSAALLIFYPLVLLLVSVAVLPLSYLMIRSVKSRLSEISDRKGKIEVDSYQYTHEIIRGYVDVKLFQKEEVFKHDLMSEFRKLYRLNAELYLYQQIPRRIIEAVVILAVAMLYTVAAVFFQTNPYDLVMILATFATAAYRLMPSINEILYHLVLVRSSNYVIDQLNVLAPADIGKQAPPVHFGQRIELADIGYHYEGRSDHQVLNGVGLEIRKGEFVVVTGESGSGKSTLGKIIAGFIHPDQGRYSIDGVPIRQLGQVRHLMGYVTQDFFLFDRTLIENIAVGEKPEAVDMGRLEAVLKASRLTEMIDTSPQGLYYPVGEMGGRLSGGQKQRLAIARALYKRAEILVLDEITSALDKQNESEVLNSIYDIAKSNGLTVFLITHRIDALRQYDAHYQMDKGYLHKMPHK